MTELERIYEWLENAPFAVSSYVVDGVVVAEIEIEQEEE